MMSNKHAYVVTDVVKELQGRGNIPNLRFFDEAIYITMHKQTCFMGFFEANPTFIEPEKDLVFGLYDLDMEAAAPHLERDSFTNLLPKQDRIFVFVLPLAS